YFSTMVNSVNKPFYYKPNVGALLLDIRNYSGPVDDGSQIPIDGQNVAGDSISRIVAFNVNSPVAQQIDSFGLVTAFVIQPVPEASTVALFPVSFGRCPVA